MDDFTLKDIENPTFSKSRLSPSEILMGVPLPKLDRIRVMSENEFEDFVRQWAWGHLKTKYHAVKHLGGAGDKGRDVLGYYENGEFDLFQCKHYASTISPSQIYVEFGKLCYYTYTNKYAVPKHYYIFSPHGPGPDLSDLIAQPTRINGKLAENWETYCLKKISKDQVLLSGDFEQYVNNFDFSIVKDYDILTAINEHANTIFHASVFGGGIRKYRDLIPLPSEEIESRELGYVTQLLEVYSEELSKTLDNANQLELSSNDLFNHFHDQRKAFFCAESLEIFSRENFPQYEVSPFDEMKDEAYSILLNLLLMLQNDKSFQRLLQAIKAMQNANFSGNALNLSHEIKILDKAGICHHLANENKIRWKR